MTNEPTNAELLATAATIMHAMRQMIATADRNNAEQVNTTMDAVHEYLAVVGGSVAILSDRLGCTDDVERIMRQGQERLRAMQANRGLGGRA